MNLAKNPAQIIHEIYTSEYITTDDFLEQFNFLYRNVPNKNQYYVKMMNKYEYLGHGTSSEMVRLDKLLNKEKVDWYLQGERENAFVTKKPDIIDFYHSLNLYGDLRDEDNKRKRLMTTDNIKLLVGMMIDIDIQNSFFNNMEAYEVYEFLKEEKIIGEVIPNINAVVYSGAGLHLIIKFKYPVPATEKSRKLVSNMQDCFANEIREYLVVNENKKLKDKKLKLDTLSLTTSTRVNKSYNSKNFNRVKFLIVDKKLQELRELQVIFDKIKPYSREKNAPKKVMHLGMAKTAGQARKTYIMLEDRKNDLIKLQQSYSDHCEGHEEQMCFLYCNFTIQQLIHNYIDTELKNDIKFEDIELTKDLKKEFFDIAYEETTTFNEGFIKPYKPRQMRSKMNILTKKNYKFSTPKIVLWLDLHEDIQWNLKTIAIPEVVVAREKVRNKKNAEKRKAERRNANGLTKRDQETQDRIDMVQKLKAEGLTQNEVTDKLGIGKATTKRHWNKAASWEENWKIKNWGEK